MKLFRQKQTRLSVIIIAKNEAKMIPDCLKSIKPLADEIILVDSGSTDSTVAISREFSATIIAADGDYSQLRNAGLKAAAGTWVFYIDADERATPELVQEVKTTISAPAAASYKLPRQNIIFGRWIKHGGYWPDPVHRLFQKTNLTGWTGKLHESPQVTGPVGLLHHHLIHYTARSIHTALSKSKHWSAIEAQLLFEAKVPPVAWWKIVKAFKLELFRQLVLRTGFLDGMPGIILAYIRAHHQASVLVNLWHLQHPSP